MAEILRVDASRAALVLPADAGAAFELVAQQVGGYLTFFPLANGGAVAVDEDGIPRQLPLNALASAMVRQTVLGTAVVLDRDERARLFGR